MNKALKKKWLKALRSGEYEQTESVLLEYGERHDGFCCLGVLLDVMGCEWDDIGQPWLNGIQLSDGGYDLINETIGEEKNDSCARDALVDMNDIQGRSFKQIANYIEKHL